MKAIKSGPISESGKVAGTLVELRRTVEDLDPKQATGVRKLLDKLPFKDRMADYFRRYESAQDHLNAIIQSLYDGQDELRRDNAALEVDKARLWDSMQRLVQYIYLTEALDTRLAAEIGELERSDVDAAVALRDDVQFYVRQKHQDLLTQLAVSIQGYLAMDLIRKNNLELIKGVDRATTTTVAALRTAVIVAQALSNQRLVLDQITALGDTTSQVVASTSELLATGAAGIQQQASEATVSVEALRTAFANVYAAMDAIDGFKAQALESMSTTVSALQHEVDRSQRYLERVRDEEVRSGARPA